MELLSTLKGAITWLGGAVAALTVLCYGAGYFALHAYLTMLGLDGIVAIAPNQMLTEGGEFWLALINQLLVDLALTVVFVMLLVVLCVLGNQVALVRRLGDAAQRKGRDAQNWASYRFSGLGWVAALAITLVAVQWHSGRYTDRISTLSGAPPQLQVISKPRPPLLFRAALNPIECDGLLETTTKGFGAKVDDLIGRGSACRHELRRDGFNDLIAGYFLLILGLLAVFSKRTEALVSRRSLIVIRLGLGLYFAVYTLSLPAVYGVLIHQPVYPYVVLRGDKGSESGFRLLQDDHNILLWSPKRHAAIWLPVNPIQTIWTDRPSNIFDPRKEQKP